MYDTYLGLSPEEFAALAKRYARFHETCNDPNEEPVRVFSPQPKKSVEELLLIREVSKDLEKKKVEDMKKAAAQQVAEEPEKTEGKEEEKSADNKEEEKKPESEK